MRKWFKSKESKRITGIILILCAALVGQIWGFFNFNKKLYDMSLEHSMEQVEELSIYVENNLELEIARYIHILQVIESQLEGEETVDREQMIAKLQRAHEISAFKMMGVSDLDGNGIDSTGNQYNISYNKIREHIEHDEVFISNVLKNGNETLIFIAVPLKINDEICGIVWGKYALADLLDNMELTEDGYKYFQIMDDKGHYLLSSKNKFALNHDAVFTGQIVWNRTGKYDDTGRISPKEICQMMQEQKSGNFYFEKDGHGRYVSYRPLKINNWYLFSVQVEDELHSYVHRARQNAVHMFTIMAIGLLAIFGAIYNLFYGMYKKIAKQNHEIQAINVMFRETLQQTKNIPFTIDYKLKQVILYGYPVKDVKQCCSFDDMRPENMVKKGLVDPNSLEEYEKLYGYLIIQQKKCDPVIIQSHIGEKTEWLRVSVLADALDSEGQMIGVLEDYGEHKEKDLKIESHSDDIKKIEEKSQIDFLTSLYNREAFMKKVQVALEGNYTKHQMGALLILDLDHFKEVNDSMGHSMGDAVLQNTAHTLSSFFRKGDIVGRLGGDEFVIFVENIRNIKAFERRIRELNHLLYKTYRKDGQSVLVSASIGVVLTEAEQVTFGDLYEKADRALYQVKESTRNGYRIYSENT